MFNLLWQIILLCFLSVCVSEKLFHFLPSCCGLVDYPHVWHLDRRPASLHVFVFHIVFFVSLTFEYGRVCLLLCF